MSPKLRKLCPCLPLLLWFVSLPAWAQDGTVTGLVTFVDGNRPVANATVRATGSAGSVVASATTNAEGRYRLSVAPGTYNISAEIIGYEPTQTNSVTVASGAAATADISLRAVAFQLNPLVISASKHEEKATEAPARVEVITERDIRERPAITPVEHLRGTPGIDVITQGAISTNVVARGFNNIFSGALHIITDNRLAGVPSLRVNVMHFIPTANEDLARMEVVLGPGAALYGPNTASGVLHMITKSPLLEPGNSLSITGGERDIFQGVARLSHRFSDRVGVKVSGSYLRGSEWEYVDPDEQAERAKFATDPFFRQDFINSLGISAAEADRRIATIGARDNDIERFSGEARVDFQATSELRTTLQAGITNVGNGVELTGLGAAQVKDWRYMYYQARANWQRLFAQAYLNTSNAGESFLLRTGQPVTDESMLFVGQVQHGMSLGDRQNFTYGGDIFYTNPRTKGTINGQYEDDDKTTEIGAYLQSETAITPKLDLVLAGRIDDHSALPDPIFSPRAAIVFKPKEDHALRATFNRAFSTPTSLNQFLDLATSVPNQSTDPLAKRAAQLGYSVRVQGTGTTGFTFRTAGGTYSIRSPFTPTALGGSKTLLPANNVAIFFPAAVQVAIAGGAGAHPLMTPARINALLTAAPSATQISTNVIVGTQSLPLSTFSLDEDFIAPIRETTTQSFEVGYKGVVAGRLSLAADVWTSKIQDFVTPLTVHRSLVALNPQEAGAFIATRLVTSGTATLAEAQALAGFLAPLLAQVPLGVISSTDVHASSAQFLATYTNVDESLDMWGIDVSAQALLSDLFSLELTGSTVDKDHFDTSVGLVTLNAPKKKGSVALAYRDTERGLNAEARVRHTGSFPVRSGVYEATRCIDNLTTSNECVKDYTLLDVTLGYSFPQLRGTSIALTVTNALDEDYQSFPGVPEVGRMALLRLRYDFGGGRE
jgi:outer membrane receptor for ferrienterochelin and colicins